MTTNFTFTVTRTGSADEEASVNYQVVPTDRFTAESADFAPDGFPTGTVNFAAGETSKTITIPFDGVKDVTEFAVQLEDVVNAQIVNGRAKAIAFKNTTSFIRSYFAPALWLDAADGDSVAIADGTTNNVVQWTDKSGNNRDATQTSNTLQPTYQNNTLQFRGDQLNIASTNLLPAGTGDFSLFIAYQLVATNTGSQAAVPLGNYLAGNFTVYLNSGSLAYATPWGVWNGASLDMSPDPSNVGHHAIISLVRSGSNWTGYTTGNQKNTVTNSVSVYSSSNTQSIWSIGGHTNGIYRYDLDIYEIIAISGTVVESDRQIIEGYLAHKWGLVADLPAEHPYKSAAPF